MLVFRPYEFEVGGFLGPHADQAALPRAGLFRSYGFVEFFACRFRLPPGRAAQQPYCHDAASRAYFFTSGCTRSYFVDLQCCVVAEGVRGSELKRFRIAVDSVFFCFGLSPFFQRQLAVGSASGSAAALSLFVEQTHPAPSPRVS